MRLIFEIEYDGATDDDDQEIRDHLASFVHAAAASGMLTSDKLAAQEVVVSQVAAACARLEDGVPPPVDPVDRGPVDDTEPDEWDPAPAAGTDFAPDEDDE